MGGKIFRLCTIFRYFFELVAKSFGCVRFFGRHNPTTAVLLTFIGISGRNFSENLSITVHSRVFLPATQVFPRKSCTAEIFCHFKAINMALTMPRIIFGQCVVAIICIKRNPLCQFSLPLKKFRLRLPNYSSGSLFCFCHIRARTPQIADIDWSIGPIISFIMRP